MPIGTWSTTNIPTDLARKSYAAAMMRYMPNGGCTLYGLTALMAEETAYQIEHGFYSKTMVFPSVTLSGAIADGVATLSPWRIRRRSPLAWCCVLIRPTRTCW